MASCDLSQNVDIYIHIKRKKAKINEKKKTRIFLLPCTCWLLNIYLIHVIEKLDLIDFCE